MREETETREEDERIVQRKLAHLLDIFQTILAGELEKSLIFDHCTGS